MLIIAAEKSFESKVRKFLNDEGCYEIKFFANSFTKKGIPDLLVCCNGYFIGVEVKAPNGKPSDLQIHNLKKIDECNGYGVLLYPKDFETFKGLIKALQTSNLSAGLYYEQLKERWLK